jgi:hypothetical protein
MLHESFATITRGLNRDLPPMRLYEKAKRLKIIRGQTLDEINRATRQVIEAGDA